MARRAFASRGRLETVFQGLPTTRAGRFSRIKRTEVALPVHARYLAKSIDVTLFHDRAVSTILQRQVFGRDSVMLTIHDDDDDDASVRSDALDPVSTAVRPSIETARPRGRQGHVVVFSYGAAVFFNVGDTLRNRCLESFRPFCTEAIPEGFQPVEDYSVVVRPPPGSLRGVARARRGARGGGGARGGNGAARRRCGRAVAPRPVAAGRRRGRAAVATTAAVRRPAVRFDYAVLPQLDVHNLAVIATVLAQSVALDHYGVKADAMLEAFTRLNSSVERTGVFSVIEKQSLFRLVALNNTLFTDVIAKIGILERSDTAWEHLEYADVWEGLRDEFEIEDRFQKIEFKLNLIQQNSKFFLEVLATDKSNTLEWIIIILISIEIAVMTVEIAAGL